MLSVREESLAMPIYEYYCDACHEKTEVMQRITADPLDTCPNCKTQGKIHRLISKTGFQLKGTGWYETDFKGAKRPGDHGHAGADVSKDSASSASSSSSSSSSSTDSTSKDTSSSASKDSSSSKAESSSSSTSSSPTAS